MTYSGSRRMLDKACRKVLHDLSRKIEHDDGGIEYPFYGEGGSTIKENDRLISSHVYLQTKDEDGHAYKITTVLLGENDPVVLLDSSCPDQHELVNTLNAEFAKCGISVRPY